MAIPKNLTVFKLTAPVSLSDLTLAVTESGQRFTPPAPQQLVSFGFVEAAPDEMLFSQGGWHLAKFRVAEKKLPATAMNQELARMCGQAERASGKPLTKGGRADLKDRLLFNLLPNLLPTVSEVGLYLNLRDGWLWVDQASSRVVDLALANLRSALGGNLPIQPLASLIGEPGLRQVTTWSRSGLLGKGSLEFEAPVWLTREESKVVCRQVELEDEETQTALTNGFDIQKLGMVFSSGSDDETAFILDDSFVFRSIKLDAMSVDEARSGADGAAAQDAADFALFTGTMTGVVDEVVRVFGSQAQEGEF